MHKGKALIRKKGHLLAELVGAVGLLLHLRMRDVKLALHGRQAIGVGGACGAAVLPNPRQPDGVARRGFRQLCKCCRVIGAVAGGLQD